MRINLLAAVTLAAFFTAGCTKAVDEPQAPAAQTQAAPAPAAAQAPAKTAEQETGVSLEQAQPEVVSSEPVVQELVNGQLPGYNPNLVVKEVKWSDPEHKAAWEARKAELQKLRAEGKLPSQQGE